MSNERTPKNPTVTKVTGPGDIVVIVPYLLGFDPTDSLVVIGLEGPRLRFGPCFRLDLAKSQRDIVADPQEALDPDVFRDLESWFASRSDAAPGGTRLTVDSPTGSGVVPP